jgi:signal transduction histidine kinase
VSNAVKYMTHSGPRRIMVGLHGATLTVSDTGVGIPQGDVPHIFKRFYRARNHTGDGTGTCDLPDDRREAQSDHQCG